MKRVKPFIASSLNDYIARDVGSVNWLYTDMHIMAIHTNYNSVDTVLMGRKTHDQT